MGYTRYWKRTAKQMDEDFVDFCKEVFKTCKKLGIKICGWDGEGEPNVTTDKISFNGDRTKDLDHETCCLSNNLCEGFDFCKTARKPYDYAVRTILREALTRGYIKDLSDDGINEEIISDDEY